jgi:hypothetical protein
MASFVQTGDPNAHKVTNASVVSVPEVDKKKQFLITGHGLENGDVDMLAKRCAFWLQRAAKVPI